MTLRAPSEITAEGHYFASLIIINYEDFATRRFSLAI